MASISVVIEVAKIRDDLWVYDTIKCDQSITLSPSNFSHQSQQQTNTL